MRTTDELEAAVVEGIIDARQAERLAAFLAKRADADPWSAPEGEASESENVRFVRGFHDIFIAVGITLLFAGLITTGPVTGYVISMLSISAVIAWTLAEFLARKRRLVLPSIVLCLAFVFCASWAIWSIIDLFTKANNGLHFIAASLMGIGAAIVFFARFTLPFALGISVASAVALVYTVLLFIDPDIVKNHSIAIFLIFGLCVFAAAMAFDLSDPGRETLRADNAFWLHLLAAPLLVHSILSYVRLGEDSKNELAGAAAVIAVLLALALVALLVDRRAMLVAGLGYLGTAIATVIGEVSVERGTVAVITLIILGTGVVALGTGWQATRVVLFKSLPLSNNLRKKLPPVRGQS